MTGVGVGNRIVLTLIGLTLLLGGLSGLTIATGWAAALGPMIGLALPTADQPLIAGDAWTTVTGRTGAAITAVAALVLAVVLLAWLIGQRPRTQAPKPMRLHADPVAGSTQLPTRALGDVVARQLEDVPGVHRASVTVSGTSADPVIAADLTIDEHADVPVILDRITQRVCADVGTALDTVVHTCSVRLEVGRGGREARRVSIDTATS